ncbi:type I restriction endonuclease [Endozoicomonas gorgoniicola]|uniref:Type I restriction endonuclease n=1 Tax=Endozoicomonas gorgoniicola TaxID=1234144 RepID=A0ABT3MYU1_9GAMM|nr:type I restriction endonuclease [Endozoicomonas gorgoniicola]
MDSIQERIFQNEMIAQMQSNGWLPGSADQYDRETALYTAGKKIKAWRIDLVLFINGLPVATLELKSEFKQSVDNAIRQYKKTRLPQRPGNRQAGTIADLQTGRTGAFCRESVPSVYGNQSGGQRYVLSAV